MYFKGISLIDQIHLGAYEIFGLEIYAYITCYEMIEWIQWLAIEFKLVWMDMIMRWYLVCGMNGYMSCDSIQTS